jgi:serine/threonine-protein kinase
MQPPLILSPYPQPGDVLDGKYKVEHLLGEGGMGAVAKATHMLRRAPVALKFMSGAVLSLQGAVERFVNEGVAASQIDSDHVVKVFDVGRLPSGAPYLVMEYLEGCDLGQLIEREGPTLPVGRAVHFTLQALRALQTAHLAGIVHRDMKPSNCFVIDKDGEPDFVKLVDFGISKVRAAEDGSSAQLTRTNSALGTPLYMSPEQARSPRDVDHRTDLYSVGAILYEMLSGRTPYTTDTGEFTEILFKIFTTEPESLAALRPDLPDGLAAVVHRALHRERTERFASANDMAEALAPYADDRSAQVLARVRAGRRSQMPGRQSTVTPVHEGARATQAEATARTFASEGAALRAAPQPASTAVGVTRESNVAVPAAKKSPALVAAIAVVVIAGLAGAGLLYARGLKGGAAADKTTSEPTIAMPPTPPPSAVVIPPPAPPSPPATQVVLAPEPAPTEAPATPSARAGNKPPTRPSAGPQPPATAPPPGSPLPTQLGDLKLH